MFYNLVYFNTYKLASIVHAVQSNTFLMIHFTNKLAATVVQYDDKLLI